MWTSSELSENSKTIRAEKDKPALKSRTVQTMEKASVKYSFLPKGGDIGFSNGVPETDLSRALLRHAAVRFVCPQAVYGVKTSRKLLFKY